MFFSSTANAAPVLWVGDRSGNLGTVDVADGTYTNIGNMGTAMTDIAFDNSGNLYGISFDKLFSIDSNSAVVTEIGSHNMGSGAKNSLVFDSAGNLFAANSSLFTLDLVTGASTLIGNGGDNYVSSGDLAFIEGELYLSSSIGDDSLVNLDTSTGAGTSIGNIGYGDVYGLASDNNIDLYGLSGSDILSIDVNTGVGTFLSSYSGLSEAWGSAFYSESGASTPVPEPTTMLLFGAGLAGLAAAGRRKK